MANEHHWAIEFYLSLVAYYVLHMIFVTSSDFVDAFSIPPLNIGIYVDKLAAIRALLMVMADILEHLLTQEWAQDPGNKKLGVEKNYRRGGSILSFIVMLVCRCHYIWILYYSNNKSLITFINLSIEGFWFGVFQMSFFAIGPQYNAVTSLGIHTMGNFIFFGQLIMQRRAKTSKHINSLYRVRVHGWVVVVTSIIALGLWVWFLTECEGEDQANKMTTALGGNPGTDNKADEWEHVLSPLLLFIVGAFAEDFSVPGILPFAFLDTDKANLVNYLTPSFFMAGATVTVLLNDVFHKGGLIGALNSKFKNWSAGSEHLWHGVWLLNIPKYIAFFIAMWCIHGTFGRLRCIVQCRWRVIVLTMFVVVPRATLETMGYVGVANFAMARQAKKGSNPDQGAFEGYKLIAVHDVLAMFCRFVYGKFAVGYNSTEGTICTL